MKRYLIFAALGPFMGGFFLLIATTVMSGYWDQPSWSQVTKLFVVFLKTLQYSYLFGILPILMMAAVDDIVFHVKRIVPVLRMLREPIDAVRALWRGGAYPPYPDMLAASISASLASSLSSNGP